MSRRPRLILYAHDNRGLGHLKRLSRVAAALQAHFSCLFITGSREAEWIVPAGCRFAHIPARDKKLHDSEMLRPRTAIDRERAVRLRSQRIAAVVRDFAPDAFIIDHLASGRHDELVEALVSSSARKYLLLRGVIDDPAKARAEVFAPSALDLMSAFSRILVASDSNISRVADEYLANESARIRSLLHYVGYVSPRFPPEVRRAVRLRLGVRLSRPWVVCSTGGGRESAEFVNQCMKLARRFPQVAFDIVRGPRAFHPDRVHDATNLRVWPASRQLPLLHAAADVVICRGGYNTMMEIAAGSAHAICVPLELDGDREQHIHARRLASYMPIQMSSGDHDDLAARLRPLLELPASRSQESSRERSTLDFDGVTKICRFVTEQFGISYSGQSVNPSLRPISSSS